MKIFKVNAHFLWMQQAYQNAEKAYKNNEIPIGAVVVDENNHLLGEGFNQCLTAHDPSAHAEIVAIRAACQKKQNYRLKATTLYVTIQPCLMCLMTMLHARIGTLIFGAPCHKSWPLVRQCEHEQLWHLWKSLPITSAEKGSSAVEQRSIKIGHLSVTGGLLSGQCARLMQDFFLHKRGENRFNFSGDV